MFLCDFPGCDRFRHARGWCSTHYMQWYREEEMRPIQLRAGRRPKGYGLALEPEGNSND